VEGSSHGLITVLFQYFPGETEEDLAPTLPGRIAGFPSQNVNSAPLEYSYSVTAI
jgi:hypothetical protein